MTWELFNAIKKIDKKAALWLSRKMPFLINRGAIFGAGISTRAGLGSGTTLRCFFVFAFTPQGHAYWDNISKQLPRHLQ